MCGAAGAWRDPDPGCQAPEGGALARFVAEAPAGKISITYGAAHFPGLLAELQTLDPAFRVQSVTAVAAMNLPREPHLAGGVPVVRR